MNIKELREELSGALGSTDFLSSWNTGRRHLLWIDCLAAGVERLEERVKKVEGWAHLSGDRWGESMVSVDKDRLAYLERVEQQAARFCDGDVCMRDCPTCNAQLADLRAALASKPKEG